MQNTLEAIGNEMENLSLEDQLKVIEALQLIEESNKLRLEEIDRQYDHIKVQAEAGEKDAQTIMNWGTEKEIKKAINDNMLRNEKATA